MKAFSGFPDGSFRPDDPLTRAQLVKIAAAAAGLTPAGTPSYPYIDVGAWYAGWVATAESAGIIGARSRTPLWVSGNLEGDRQASRAEAAMMLFHLLSVRR